jgi:hypothetical protein
MSNWWTIGVTHSTHHGLTNLLLSVTPSHPHTRSPTSCNTTQFRTTTTLPTVKHHFCHRHIFLLKAPKARMTGRQSMDHTYSIIRMIETMKLICLSIKRRGDVSIAIGAFADMDRLPDFDDMVVHPALLVPHKIPVDEAAMLPYFLKLLEAAPREFNATPFVMAHTIPFCEIQVRVALHIWPHSIKISPDRSDPYDIPNDMSSNSQTIYQKCASKPSSEEKKASLLVIENCLFDRLQDSFKLQTRAIYDILHHFLEDPHFDLVSNLKGIPNRFTIDVPGINRSYIQTRKSQLCI